MKPKPFSVRLRFFVLQSVSIALALWFIGAAVFVTLRIRKEVAAPVEKLKAALPLGREIDENLEDLLLIAVQAHHHPEQPRDEFRRAVRTLADLTNRYEQLAGEDDRVELETLRDLESELVDRLELVLLAKPGTPEAAALIEKSRELGTKIEMLTGSLSRAQLEQLDTSTQQLREYTRILYLLLTGFALYAVLVIRVFRRNHRLQLWEPLAELMEMVREARRGNFDMRPRVPRSVEVGPLVESFVSLTGEVREMRESLEQKVKERTAELEAAQKQLLQAAKLSAVGQLVSGVAHEVNNPLTSILGFSEILLGNPALDAASRRQLEMVRDETLRIRDLVTHLTRFARRAPHRTVRLDLRRVLERVVELRRYQLTAGGIRLHYEPPAAPVWVEGDPDQLLQVLFNLVLNSEQAIEAERGEGDIWLVCRRENGAAAFEVRDNGAGMSAQVAERIFEPFFTTKPVGQGTGLGLSISHGIVEQHNGLMIVESTPGAGTTMRIELPAAEPPDSSAAVATLAPQEAPLTAGRALVIDDEDGIAMLVQHALERRGWSVTTLTDSTKAENVLASAGFDIVISDLKMPGTTGIEILSLLRKKYPELAKRFLLMTGDLGDTDKRLLARAKIQVLRKPFTLAQLSEAVRGVTQSQPS